jgi:hypothetical protein
MAVTLGKCPSCGAQNAEGSQFCARWEVALSEAALSRVCLAAGDNAAGSQAARARAVFEELGAARELEQLDQLLG